MSMPLHTWLHKSIYIHDIHIDDEQYGRKYCNFEFLIEPFLLNKMQRVKMYNKVRKDKHAQYKNKSEYKKSESTKSESAKSEIDE